MQGLDDIEAAFSKVRTSVEAALKGDQASKDRCFEDIFALNNQIGRLGRERRETMPKMKELQECVNMVTVGLKYGRTKDLREGLGLIGESISSMKRESTSRPQGFITGART